MDKEQKTKKPAKKESYIEALGRRKTAVARVRLADSSKASFTVNGKDIKEYFAVEELRQTALAPLKEAKIENKTAVTAKTTGGGVASQAEAIRLGISRALISRDQELKKALKKLGYLKRDPRMKERRKFGLKKARKAPQWSKR